MLGSGGSHFLPDWDGLVKRKSVLAQLEWLGMAEVCFGLPRMAYNKGSPYWPNWDGFEWRKMFLA
jgi:hypothetical protein